ncbi:lipopolysaccharide assembly protein LapB, partial [Vibrio fortis]
PIAAAYGWYMGNRNAQQEKQKQSHQISRQYVTGLNLLLSDQSDKAVDHFIELLQVDNETIDTHLALGNLFRSRGEVDRAIRIHQKSALQQLVSIYQQTREWNKAIQYGNVLIKISKKKLKMRATVAHFWCEMAMQEQAEGNKSKAIQHFKKALNEDPKCVRASIALSKIHLANEEYKKAIEYLESVVDQDIDFISEVLPTLADCYHHLGQEAQLVEFLKVCIQKKAGVSAELMLAQLVAQHEDIGSAQELLTKQLLKNPTMKGFYRLIDYHIAEAEEGRAKNSLTTLQSMVGEQLKMKPHYRCRKCGFSTHSLYWHCPSCKGWGTIKPIRGLDGE